MHNCVVMFSSGISSWAAAKRSLALDTLALESHLCGKITLIKKTNKIMPNNLTENLTTRGNLQIQITVDCPHCDELLDILDSKDTNNYHHNDTGDVLSDACGGDDWSEDHEKFKLTEVTCSECKGVFSVEGLNW